MNRRRTSGHQELVDDIAARLEASNTYNSVESNIEYTVGDLNGEFDILTHRNVYVHYYEIKSNHNPDAVSRAYKQFLRAQQAYPNTLWQFIYIAPGHVERFTNLLRKNRR